MAVAATWLFSARRPGHGAGRGADHWRRAWLAMPVGLTAEWKAADRSANIGAARSAVESDLYQEFHFNARSIQAHETALLPTDWPLLRLTVGRRDSPCGKRPTAGGDRRRPIAAADGAAGGPGIAGHRREDQRRAFADRHAAGPCGHGGDLCRTQPAHRSAANHGGRLAGRCVSHRVGRRPACAHRPGHRVCAD